MFLHYVKLVKLHHLHSEIMKLSHQFQVSHRPFLTAVMTPVLND